MIATLAFRHLWVRKVRSAFLLLGFALGVAVMVVDDFADARESLVAVLGLAGAATIDFESGRETLAWLQDHPPEDWPTVLVCDISLGYEDGYEVMRQVRHLEHERAVPLEQRMSAVALTGLARPEDRIRAFMAGFQAHLAKPADPRELVATVAGLAGPGGSGPPALPATSTARLTGPT